MKGAWMQERVSEFSQLYHVTFGQSTATARIQGIISDSDGMQMEPERDMNRSRSGKAAAIKTESVKHSKCVTSGQQFNSNTVRVHLQQNAMIPVLRRNSATLWFSGLTLSAMRPGKIIDTAT